MENQYACHNYHPLPVVIARGKGCYLYDIDGNEYFDFLAAYSAANQGHCHPRMIKAMTEQMSVLTLCSRAFYNDQLGQACKILAEMFNFDKALLMNSGAEAVESAIKLARRWGYEKKQVPDNQAVVVVASENFHGRTTGVISFSTDPESFGGFGPLMGGFSVVPFNDASALEEKLKSNPNIVAFLVEPVQGEAGVVVPSPNYLRDAYRICKQYNCLLICDEIQCGLGRVGAMSATAAFGAQCDMLLLGKALSGGMMPVSAILANDEVMLCIKPGQHGSTYGGNPLACVAMREALAILTEENLSQRSFDMGNLVRERLEEMRKLYPHVIKEVRGMGMMNAMVIESTAEYDAWKVCVMLRDEGVLAKPTHSTIVRLTPPLCMSKEEVTKACDLIQKVIQSLAA